MIHNPDITLDDIFQKMQTYTEVTSDIKKQIRSAYRFAKEAHGQYGIDSVTGALLRQPQRRKSGELYINHSLHTALILAERHLDPESIVTGLLHDVIEDTARTEDDIRKEFGDNIARMCAGLAKLSRVRYEEDENSQIDSLRRMFVAMAEDMRVIFVKLADRLHNMRTLDFVRVDKHLRIAKETLEIFAPLAYRLGMFEIKVELENLCLKYLHPVEYAEISGEMKKREKEDQDYIDRVHQELLKIMAEEKIIGRMEGRVKHLYSIFNKMSKKGVSLDEIYDRLAVRIIVPSKRDCYTLLGAIHSHWQPKLGCFKDYIALPKANGYQSLHTVVYPFRGEDRQPTEIQIRTERMHQEAEYGLAAHWLYSEQSKESMIADDRQRQWITALNEIKKELGSNDFDELLRTDLLENRIFVFTPHGQVIDLPKGSTPVDFAFSVHTEVGLKCSVAQIDGKIVPLDSTLHNGQTVKIITDELASPSYYWLSFVKTSVARNNIRQFLRNQDYERNLSTGREIFQEELDRYGLQLKEGDTNLCQVVLSEIPYENFDDLLVAIGTGSLSATIVINKIFATKFEAQETEKQNISTKDKLIEPPESFDVVVEGVTSQMNISTSACCGEKLGDYIIGYVTQGQGIAIHRTDCPSLKEVDPSRLVTAYFRGQKKSYPVEIAVFASHDPGIFRQTISVLDKYGIELDCASFFTGTDVEKYNPPDNTERIFVFQFQVENFGRLQSVFQSMESLSGVLGVRRLLNND